MFFLIQDLFSLIKNQFFLIKDYSLDKYEIWKLGNLRINTHCVFTASIYLSIVNLPYTKEWPARGLKTLDETPRILHLGRHPSFRRRAFGFSRLVVPPGFNMVGGLGPLHIAGQVGLRTHGHWAH